MATMKEVADEAQVSIATVSRVLNNTGYVSPDLELRVRQAMEKLQYHPSQLARSLRRQETRTVGVLIPQLNQPFFSTLAYAVEKSLFAQDYRTLICSAEEDGDKEKEYIEMLLRQRVEGVVVVPTGHSAENLKPLIQRDIAIVLVDRDLAGLQVSRVLSDNFTGGYTGMKHLLELGHRDIGVIGAPAYSEAMVQRLAGVRKALDEYGANRRPELLITGSMHQFEMGHTATRQLLQQTPHPTAIFALTDVMAVGVMHAAAEADLNLPDDLSIMGYDNIPMSSFSIPALTTISQPIYEMGEMAAERLLAHIHDPSLPDETITLQTDLIVRQSTCKLRSVNS